MCAHRAAILQQPNSTSSNRYPQLSPPYLTHRGSPDHRHAPTPQTPWTPAASQFVGVCIVGSTRFRANLSSDSETATKQTREHSSASNELVLREEYASSGLDGERMQIPAQFPGTSVL